MTVKGHEKSHDPKRDNSKLDDPSAWRRRVFRCRKEDSAYLYAVMEAHEGVAVASTLKHAVGDLHRDVELQFSVDFEAELESILDSLRAEGIELHEIVVDRISQGEPR